METSVIRDVSSIKEFISLIEIWKVTGVIDVDTFGKFTELFIDLMGIESLRGPSLDDFVTKIEIVMVQKFKELNALYADDDFMIKYPHKTKLFECSTLQQITESFNEFKASLNPFHSETIQINDEFEKSRVFSYFQSFKKLLNQVPFVKELDDKLFHTKEYLNKLIQNQNHHQAISLADAIAIILKNPNAQEILKGMQMICQGDNEKEK